MSTEAGQLHLLCETWPDQCQADTDKTAGERIPAKAYLRGTKVERVQYPGDGDLYKQDIDSWFPKSVRGAATFPGNNVVSSMEKAARKDAGCTG